jgi:hypothetical protein
LQGSDAGKLRDPHVPRIHPVAVLQRPEVWARPWWPSPSLSATRPALPRPRGRFVPDQTPFLHVSDRGFRRAAARRRRLPWTPLRRALPDRQLARDVVGSRHDSARPHVDDIPWGPYWPERRADTAVTDNLVLARPALPADTLRDPAPLGRNEPAAADVRSGGAKSMVSSAPTALARLRP